MQSFDTFQIKSRAEMSPLFVKSEARRVLLLSRLVSPAQAWSGSYHKSEVNNLSLNY